MKVLLLTWAFLLFSFPVYAEEEILENVGPGKAVTEASHELGFQLAPAALRRLGIEWETLPSSPFSVPNSAIVYFQDEVGVYRLRNGWFRLVEVRITQQNDATARILTDELKSGDAVAVRGAGFLRVTDMELFGEHGGGHGH